MVAVVNIVGSGNLCKEMSLEAIADDLDIYKYQYDPSSHPGLYLNFGSELPTATIYRTGRYHITGASSTDELHSTHRQLLDVLEGLGITFDREICLNTFSIKNIVSTASYTTNLNLSALMVALGLEHTEYEPEQFPGLIYRLDDPSAVIIIFASGKLVITGVTTIDAARDAFETLSEQLDAHLDTSG